MEGIFSQPLIVERGLLGVKMSTGEIRAESKRKMKLVNLLWIFSFPWFGGVVGIILLVFEILHKRRGRPISFRSTNTTQGTKFML